MSDSFWTNFFLLLIAIVNVGGTIALGLMQLHTQKKVSSVEKSVNGVVANKIAQAERLGRADGRLEEMDKVPGKPQEKV